MASTACWIWNYAVDFVWWWFMYSKNMRIQALNNILIVPTLLKCDGKPDIQVCTTYQDLAMKIMWNKLNGTTPHNYIYWEDNILFFNKQHMLALMVHHHQVLYNKMQKNVIKNYYRFISWCEVPHLCYTISLNLLISYNRQQDVTQSSRHWLLLT